MKTINQYFIYSCDSCGRIASESKDARWAEGMANTKVLVHGWEWVGEYPGLRCPPCRDIALDEQNTEHMYNVEMDAHHEYKD
jgi:hypothetical protein